MRNIQVVTFSTSSGPLFVPRDLVTREKRSIHLVMVCVANFDDCLFREETTTRFSMTHGPLVSPSTPLRTRPGSVGSSSLTLAHLNADVLNCSHPMLQSLPLTKPPSEFLWVSAGTTTTSKQNPGWYFNCCNVSLLIFYILLMCHSNSSRVILLQL